MTLVETLQDSQKADAVVRDGVLFIDREVRSKSGLRGLALKGGTRLFKKSSLVSSPRRLAHCFQSSLLRSTLTTLGLVKQGTSPLTLFATRTPSPRVCWL